MESSREKCPNFFVPQSSSAVGAFFRKKDDILVYYDVDGLMNAFGIKLDPEEWDSRANTLHYLKRDWPQRKSLKVSREKNVQRPALAE